MKKIPSLFKRAYEDDRLAFDEIVEGSEWVFNEKCIPTIKFDGTACMIKNGVLFKRYDRKRSKKYGYFKDPPEGWIPCEESPDRITGHWPGWLEVLDLPENKYHVEAFNNGNIVGSPDKGTFELMGPKIQGNPYNLKEHELWRHGFSIVHPSNELKNYEDIKKYLQGDIHEGIVWHHADGRMAKAKRKDFGFKWPVKTESKD